MWGLPECLFDARLRQQLVAGNQTLRATLVVARAAVASGIPRIMGEPLTR